MKTVIHSPTGLKLKTGVAAFALAFGGMFMTGIAQANTSAGTVLTNSVTVDYDDAAGTAQTQEVASVDVTVDLVPSVVWGLVVTPATQTVDSQQALPTEYLVDLTNTGNGSDTYTVADNTTESCTTGSLGTESFTFSVSETLGATVTSGVGVLAGGNTAIPVSNLNTIDLAVGNTVVINNGVTEYTVVAGTTTTSLVLSGDVTADFATAGLQVGERLAFSYGSAVSAGLLAANATGCAHAHELAATGTLATGGNTNIGPIASAPTVTWETLVEGVQLTVAKYVRNDTNAGKNPTYNAANDVTYNSIEYYAASVSGNPGDILTYLVVIENASSGEGSNVIFADTLPAFTSIYS